MALARLGWWERQSQRGAFVRTCARVCVKLTSTDAHLLCAGSVLVSAGPWGTGSNAEEMILVSEPSPSPEGCPRLWVTLPAPELCGSSNSPPAQAASPTSMGEKTKV